MECLGNVGREAETPSPLFLTLDGIPEPGAHSDDSGFTFFFKFCSDLCRKSAGGPPRSTECLSTVEEAYLYLVPGDFPEAARKHLHLRAVCSSLKENSPRRLMRVVGREAGGEDEGPGEGRVIWVAFSRPDDISVTFELGVRKRTQPCVWVLGPEGQRRGLGWHGCGAAGL